MPKVRIIQINVSDLDQAIEGGHPARPMLAGLGAPPTSLLWQDLSI